MWRSKNLSAVVALWVLLGTPHAGGLMWGGHSPPALSLTVTGSLQLPGDNGEGNTRATVVASPALVMPKGNLPGGENLLLSSSEGPMEGW